MRKYTIEEVALKDELFFEDLRYKTMMSLLADGIDVATVSDEMVFQEFENRLFSSREIKRWHRRRVLRGIKNGRKKNYSIHYD